MNQWHRAGCVGNVSSLETQVRPHLYMPLVLSGTSSQLSAVSVHGATTIHGTVQVGDGFRCWHTYYIHNLYGHPTMLVVQSRIASELMRGFITLQLRWLLNHVPRGRRLGIDSAHLDFPDRRRTGKLYPYSDLQRGPVKEGQKSAQRKGGAEKRAFSAYASMPTSTKCCQVARCRAQTCTFSSSIPSLFPNHHILYPSQPSHGLPRCLSSHGILQTPSSPQQNSDTMSQVPGLGHY